MKKIRNKNKIILFILILVIGIGYAYISTNLNMITNLTFGTNRWNVYFNNVNETHGSEFVTVHPATESNTTQSLSFTVNLPKPGDYYEFTAYIVSESDVDTMVSLKTESSLTQAQQQYAEYSITYIDGVPIEEQNLLRHFSEEQIKVVVRYKTDITQEILEAEKDPINISLSLEYTIADNNAKYRDRNYVKIIGGETLRSKMLSLANGQPIQHFRRVLDMDNRYKTNNNIISTNESYQTVYAWYDNGYINVYSNIGYNSIYFTDLYKSFYNFTDLIDINFSGFSADLVKSMHSMCEGDLLLEEFNHDYCSFDNIEDISYAFKNCSSLQLLHFSSISKKLKDARSMCENCTSLTNTALIFYENVENMNSLFKNCTSLVSCDLDAASKTPIQVFKRLKDVESLFENCTSLKSLDLRSVNFSTIENIHKMFYGCSQLETIYANQQLEINLNKAKANDTDYDIFTGCISLRGGNSTLYDSNYIRSEYATIGGYKYNYMTNTWEVDNTVKGYFKWYVII